MSITLQNHTPALTPRSRTMTFYNIWSHVSNLVLDRVAPAGDVQELPLALIAVS